jgi:hypothetical protein
MTSLDTGIAAVRSALVRLGDEWRRFGEIPAVRTMRKGAGQVRDGWRRMKTRHPFVPASDDQKRSIASHAPPPGPSPRKAKQVSAPGRRRRSSGVAGRRL